jgi:hypothetical protein
MLLSICTRMIFSDTLVVEPFNWFWPSHLVLGMTTLVNIVYKDQALDLKKLSGGLTQIAILNNGP